MIVGSFPIGKFTDPKRRHEINVIKSCRRVKGSASDSDLYDIKWNLGLLDTIKKHHIKKI